jgi:hypothetical protein
MPLRMKEGDTTIAFFHAHANARRRRNHMRSLWHGDWTLLSKEDKADAIFDFFNYALAHAY